MSLDVYLISEKKVFRKGGTGVFVRDNGKTRELSEQEVVEKWPNAVVNIQEDFETNTVFEANITHNLNQMAKNAYLYNVLWRPDEHGYVYAKDIIPKLEKGLKKLLNDPERFEEFNPDNGWGTYENLVEFVKNYLRACVAYPDAKIEVSR